MDRNSILGIIIIAGLFIVWGIFNTPSAEEKALQQHRYDSIQRVAQQAEAAMLAADTSVATQTAVADSKSPVSISDTI